MLCLLFIYALLLLSDGREHHLEIKDDIRLYIVLSRFGILRNGFLYINATNFTFNTISSNEKKMPMLGLSLDRTQSEGMNSYAETHLEKCPILSDVQHPKSETNLALIFLHFDFINKLIKVECTKPMQKLLIYHNKSNLMYPVDVNPANDFYFLRPKRNIELFNKESKNMLKDSNLFGRRNLVLRDKRQKSKFQCGAQTIPLKQTLNGSYSFELLFSMISKEDEGLYTLFFHNCDNYQNLANPTVVTFLANIINKNEGGYLSAEEMPLPYLYLIMSAIFFLIAYFWLAILRKSPTKDVLKLHWLMLLLVFIKGLSLLFHGINYYYINQEGFHLHTWAILYYIVHLLKGALLFTTIVLVGTGWTFIKHMLSEKDKKLFLVVIPLQIIVNIAVIIIEESEEGSINYTFWQETFILTDLVCCVAILLPVVWSIRHLQDASTTDGKAAINLKKLRLFRHFYIMVVCYIYFTRIIVYMLRISVPFRYAWMDELFRESATLVFFIMTGSKFRPTGNNPYLHLPQEDSEVEMDEV